MLKSFFSVGLTLSPFFRLEILIVVRRLWWVGRVRELWKLLVEQEEEK